jgi:TolB-like protein
MAFLALANIVFFYDLWYILRHRSFRMTHYRAVDMLTALPAILFAPRPSKSRAKLVHFDKKFFILCLFITLFGGAAAAKDALAVLPFTGGDRGEGETIAELFSFAPALNNAFDPIPRTSIAQAISNEQNFQMSMGMTDPDTIAAIGKQLGARYVVAGNIAKLGNRNLLIISILKIDDLRQIAGDIQTYARIEEIRNKLPEMAWNIINAIQIDSSFFTKLAVLPVVPDERGGAIDARVADTLAQILSIYLIRSGHYAVYPRTATLEQVQTEYKTQMTVVADENLVDMGKGDNPQFVLSVAARRLGEQSMFNASIINLESGVQTTGASKNYNLLEDGIEVMINLASELTGIPASILAPPAIRNTGIPASIPVPSPIMNTDVPRKTSGGFNGKILGYGALNLALGLGSFIQKDWPHGLLFLGGYAAAGGLIAWELTLEYDDAIAGIPGAIGLGVAGATALYGFIRPFIYEKHRALINQTDRIRVSVVPGNRGATALNLTYTLQF